MGCIWRPDFIISAQASTWNYAAGKSNTLPVLRPKMEYSYKRVVHQVEVTLIKASRYLLEFSAVFSQGTEIGFKLTFLHTLTLWTFLKAFCLNLPGKCCKSLKPTEIFYFLLTAQNPAQVFVGVGSMHDWVSNYHISFSGLNKDFPDNVHLLSVKARNDSQGSNT